MTSVKLSEIADIFNGVRLSRYADDKGFVHKVFSGKPSDEIEWQEELVSSKLNPKYFSKKNDILIHLQNTEKIHIIKDEGIIIPMHYAVIRLTDDFNPVFIYYLLKSADFQSKLNRFKEGSTLHFIKLNDLKGIEIDIPDIENQDEYSKLFELIDYRLKLNMEQNRLLNEFKDGFLTKMGDTNG